jgi:hypothetical protein
MPDLIPIASYPTSAEAELACGRLAAAGVPAKLDGAVVADMAWHIGSALGGVKVLVSSDDAEQAHAILQETDTEDETPAWDCPVCGAEVDAGFQVCWSCGAAYPESVGSPEADNTTADVVTLPERTEVKPCRYCAEDIPASSEVCPLCGEPLQKSAADAKLRDALATALIGIVIFPGILHLYSMYKLYRYFGLCDAERREASGLAWVTLVLDLVALVVLYTIFRSVVQ